MSQLSYHQGLQKAKDELIKQKGINHFNYWDIRHVKAQMYLFIVCAFLLGTIVGLLIH